MFRVVYDGKDNFLRLEQNTEKEFTDEWREISEEHVSGQNLRDIVNQIVLLIGKCDPAGK